MDRSSPWLGRSLYFLTSQDNVIGLPDFTWRSMLFRRSVQWVPESQRSDSPPLYFLIFQDLFGVTDFTWISMLFRRQCNGYPLSRQDGSPHFYIQEWPFAFIHVSPYQPLMPFSRDQGLFSLKAHLGSPFAPCPARLVQFPGFAILIFLKLKGFTLPLRVILD